MRAGHKGKPANARFSPGYEGAAEAKHGAQQKVATATGEAELIQVVAQEQANDAPIPHRTK